MTGWLKVAVGTAVGCGLGILVASTGILHRMGTLRDPEPAAPASPAISPSEGSFWLEPPAGAAAPEHSRFAELASRAAPGVVKVATSKTVVQAPDLPGFPFLGRSPGATPGPQEFEVPSLGTGFVISADGYIVTNYHVVDGVDSIQVMFLDGSASPAVIVGQDPKTDIALIRVEGRQDLHPLTLGSSEAVLPGDWVVAIGNPFGLEHTVTVGIVSAKGRDIGQGPYDDFIQTDAAINPGNSGGPLLNVAGQVIGINTAINPRANTIGFAVPIDVAKEILPQLREQGRVTRGWLGVSIQSVTPELAEALQIDAGVGALVGSVASGSPADEAGIQRGDLIVGFGGEPVQRMRDLPRLVSRTSVGDSVNVDIVREGSPDTLRVRVGQLPEPTLAVRAKAPTGGAAAFGLEVADLTPAQRKRLGARSRGGVLVRDVTPGEPAGRAGLRKGDLLLEVNRAPVASAADLDQKLDATGVRALLLVQRGVQTAFVPMRRPRS